MSESSDSRGRAVRKVKPFLEELEAKPFWTHLREHKLTAQRCKSCDKFFTFPPQGSCPHCLSTDYEWVGLSGKSEEHTSELQSRPHLVCRLLLEKKKNNNLHEKNQTQKIKKKYTSKNHRQN